MSNKLTKAAAILEWALGYCYSVSHGGSQDPEDNETAAYLAKAVRVLEIVEREADQGPRGLYGRAITRSILAEAEASAPAPPEHCLACLAVDRTGVDDGHPHTCAQSL